MISHQFIVSISYQSLDQDHGASAIHSSKRGAKRFSVTSELLLITHLIRYSYLDPGESLGVRSKDVMTHTSNILQASPKFVQYVPNLEHTRNLWVLGTCIERPQGVPHSDIRSPGEYSNSLQLHAAPKQEAYCFEGDLHPT